MESGIERSVTERSSQESSHSFSLQDFSDTHASSLECGRLWHRLKDVQAGLQDLPGSSKSLEVLPGSIQSQNQAYGVLQEYEKRLRAELAYLQEKGPQAFLSENKEIQYIVLQKDQMRRKQQLKETLSFVTAKHSSLVDSIKQEEELNKTLLKVQDALKAKDQALNQSAQENCEDDSSPDAAILDLKAKLKKVKQANKHFQSSLIDLLSKFPSPAENVQHRKKSKSALDNTRDFDEGNFTDLSSIIGQLMEQTLNSPEQPYIEITERMWQQHIEFLLRSQVIVKDPECSTRIRLIPFHL